MPRQSISFTPPNSAWLDQKVNVEREYRSNSEAVNDLIRKAREIELLRLRLTESETERITGEGETMIVPGVCKGSRRTENNTEQREMGLAYNHSRRRQ